MRYILFQILVVFFSAMFLLFLFQQESFSPKDLEGNVDWYSVSTVLFFVFLSLQSIFSIVLFIFQKFLTCGIKEFPSFNQSLKWGVIVSFLFILILILNLFNVINLTWGLVILVLITIFLILIKI
jgi:hypothetical protein